MKINTVIIRPVLTEKATQAAQNKVYTFEVNKNANKTKVKNVIEKLYSVKIASMRVNIKKGKTKKVGRRMVEKKLPNRKIINITVKEGKIDLFPQT